MMFSSAVRSGKQADVLVGAGDAVAGDDIGTQAVDPDVVEVDLASGGMDEGGQAVEQRGFARTVWTDDGMDGAFRQREVDAVDRQQAAVTLADAARPEERTHASSRRAMTLGLSPSGLRRTMAITTKP